MKRARLRDLGLSIGSLPTGPLNAITDVGGVLVGHETIIRDQPRVVRSGVTVIVPENGNIWRNHLFAGVHVLNGNGEMTGGAFLEEFGLLAGPIAITSTHSVGAVYEGLVRYKHDLDLGFDLFQPVVAETDDGQLSDSAAFAIRPDHVHAALKAARSGAVLEGNVGGGTGMNAHEFKAGIGTASRCVEVAGGHWTVGVLVQANYGRRNELRLDGRPIGSRIPTHMVPSPWSNPKDEGSIIVIVATDAPLLPLQCKRLAQRAGLGVGRVGGTGAPGSGDLFLAFSTGNTHSMEAVDQLHSAQFLPDLGLGPIFGAVIEATEEGIWNALCAAEDMIGQRGRRSAAIPLDLLEQLASP